MLENMNYPAASKKQGLFIARRRLKKQMYSNLCIQTDLNFGAIIPKMHRGLAL